MLTELIITAGLIAGTPAAGPDPDPVVEVLEADGSVDTGPDGLTFVPIYCAPDVAADPVLSGIYGCPEAVIPPQDPDPVTEEPFDVAAFVEWVIGIIRAALLGGR